MGGQRARGPARSETRRAEGGRFSGSVGVEWVHREKLTRDQTRKKEILLAPCVHVFCPQQPGVSCVLGTLYAMLLRGWMPT